MMKMHTALTIAGSDSSGGAGIQADLKTMTAHGVYGMSAVTALTAQNTTGVTDILAVPPAFLAAQLDAVFADIPPDAVKIGMVADAALIHVIAEKLDEYDAKNVVVDPVMVATSEARLISEDAVEALVSELLPRAALITPNIPEAEVLADMAITDRTAMTAAAARIHERTHAAVLMKGGHSVDDANDLLVDDTGARWFEGRRIATSNTHGTGCTLSSAIASNLARGIDTDSAVAQAKAYLSGALAAGLDLGHGSGPLAHTFDLKSRFIV
ncbi:bifunctional hydroxymethylpyrimidine kinase/phosphomethylpyrimidine kinase [Selenomonas noxia]|uniref:bifunctional hydroxymethylpyrimidine kinase/phosphomethylpyrimidine kinase n=1 Tax=Selenomonas noxia TaxID=135083 RepID=UPI00288BDBC4|nr:bifunctional hydroxymethylpyrimidine kinase/phosphomethylpyrimidine kinase [Selenomonas noxia]